MLFGFIREHRNSLTRIEVGISSVSFNKSLKLEILVFVKQHRLRFLNKYAHLPELSLLADT